jgi:hypothetical protein
MNDWPTIRASQAVSLKGKPWNIEGQQLSFGAFHVGGEAFACAMVNSSGEPKFFLRFLNKRFIRPGRIHRTAWLIGQRMNQVSELFVAAPRSWASTLTSRRPPGIDFDFTATVHTAVPGSSWREIKAARVCAQKGYRPLPPQEIRIEAAKQLISKLATFESIGTRGFVHGDLSDGNIVFDVGTGDLRIIDFDAFVYHDSSTLNYPSLSISGGGVKGTPGYCPLDLEINTTPEAAPYSDRHARDMLLLELLGFMEGDPFDSSPQFWGNQSLTLEAVAPGARKLGLPYLCQPSVFTATEDNRPSSRQLASILNLSITRIAS